MVKERATVDGLEAEIEQLKFNLNNLLRRVAKLENAATPEPTPATPSKAQRKTKAAKPDPTES